MNAPDQAIEQAGPDAAGAAASLVTDASAGAQGEAVSLSLANVTHLYQRRRVLVASHLRQLGGPSSGIVTLPVWLDWSRDDAAVFNLDDPRQRPAFYRTVLREAAYPADLQTLLNADLLVELWPDLVLPEAVRAAWEEQHPVLAEAGSARRLRPAS